MAHSFRGGIHPPYRKEATSGLAIERAELPAEVVIPLHQHTGAPCDPLVKKGDEVGVGQKIGDADAFVSAPVHAPVAGKVKAVERRPHPLGMAVMSVVITVDRMASDLQFERVNRLEEMDADAIRQVVREAGIVGLGGAAFPTAVKLSPPPEHKPNRYLLNAAECEPYLTADHRLLVERSGDVVRGFSALMKAAEVDRGTIVIEDNKPDAIAVIEQLTADRSDIDLCVVHTKYPQGSEKHMIKAVLNREVPSGALPFHVGVLVSNVGTAVAVLEAIDMDKPLLDRVVTVTGGAIARPANLLVRIGTPMQDLIDQCGGFSEQPTRVVMGGPMMGVALGDLSVPVVKATSGLLALTARESRYVEPSACIRCGRCVDICPMGLVPAMISAYAERDRFEEADDLYAMDCVECGSCAYVCPADRLLVQAIRTAKLEIGARRKKG